MHELGHDVDYYTSPTPSGVAAFVTAANNAINAMTGQWPNTQSPTCAQVYGTAAGSICIGGNLSISPWQIYLNMYIQTQPLFGELFADSFQNCSGYVLAPPFAGQDAAEQSTYMMSLWTYMNASIWTGGCPRREP